MISVSDLTRRAPQIPKTPILCVTPPSIFLLDERVFMALGILKVAAVLEQAGAAIEALDLSGVVDYLDVLGVVLGQTAAKHVCITGTTSQMPAVTKIAERIRAQRPDMKIILGGPHATLVWAACKLEKKHDRVGRADKAFCKLLPTVDAVVAGDGEIAIFEALRAVTFKGPQLIDADELGPLFMRNEDYEQMPRPARHLADVTSYHYMIDGHPATSLIAQLGCLVAGTRIEYLDGCARAIEDVRVGDAVVSFNATTGIFETHLVHATWSRDADDVWELTLQDGTTLQVTEEHPLWTRTGWVQVRDVVVGAEVGQVPQVRRSDLSNRVDLCALSKEAGDTRVRAVRPQTRTDSGVRPQAQLLRSALSSKVAEVSCEHALASGGAARHAREVVSHVSRGACGSVQHQGVVARCEDTACPPHLFRNEARGAEPDEAAGGRGGGIAYDAPPLDSVFSRADTASLARGTHSAEVGAGAYGRDAEQARTQVGRDSWRGGAPLYVHGKLGVLDRPVRIGEAAQPGLHRQTSKEGHLASRRVLALEEVCSHREEGLRICRVDGVDRLVQRPSGTETAGSAGQDQDVRFIAVVRKSFIGRRRVFNITVCPGHSYVANGLVVHNCPYKCTFCAGRHSKMLRKIRTRSTASIVAEVEHLHRTYGFTGFMLHDDELNVNKEVVGLMDALYELQNQLGVSFGLRGFIKAELFTEEQAVAMRRAGFRWLLCGFEAADPRILLNIEKNATVEDNTRVMEIASKHGLKVKALMSVGHAGETPESIQAIADWLLRVKPADFDCTIITPYPGSPYYDEALPHESVVDGWTYTARKTGDKLHAFDVDYTRVADYYKGTPGEYHSYVWTDALACDDIVRARDKVERDVREALGIPFYTTGAAIRFEHSMGQSELPKFILRTSAGAAVQGTPTPK